MKYINYNDSKSQHVYPSKFPNHLHHLPKNDLEAIQDSGGKLFHDNLRITPKAFSAGMWKGFGNQNGSQKVNVILLM